MREKDIPKKKAEKKVKYDPALSIALRKKLLALDDENLKLVLGSLPKDVRAKLKISKIDFRSTDNTIGYPTWPGLKIAWWDIPFKNLTRALELDPPREETDHLNKVRAFLEDISFRKARLLDSCAAKLRRLGVDGDYATGEQEIFEMQDAALDKVEEGKESEKTDPLPKEEHRVGQPVAVRVGRYYYLGRVSKTVYVNEETLLNEMECIKCKIGDHESVLMLCSNCDEAIHSYCLPQPLWRIPDDDYYCVDCERDRKKAASIATTQSKEKTSKSKEAERDATVAKEGERDTEMTETGEGGELEPFFYHRFYVVFYGWDASYNEWVLADDFVPFDKVDKSKIPRPRVLRQSVKDAYKRILGVDIDDMLKKNLPKGKQDQSSAFSSAEYSDTGHCDICGYRDAPLVCAVCASCFHPRCVHLPNTTKPDPDWKCHMCVAAEKFAAAKLAQSPAALTDSNPAAEIVPTAVSSSSVETKKTKSSGQISLGKKAKSNVASGPVACAACGFVEKDVIDCTLCNRRFCCGCMCVNFFMGVNNKDWTCMECRGTSEYDRWLGECVDRARERLYSGNASFKEIDCFAQLYFDLFTNCAWTLFDDPRNRRAVLDISLAQMQHGYQPSVLPFHLLHYTTDLDLMRKIAFCYSYGNLFKLSPREKLTTIGVGRDSRRIDFPPPLPVAAVPESPMAPGSPSGQSFSSNSDSSGVVNESRDIDLEIPRGVDGQDVVMAEPDETRMKLADDTLMNLADECPMKLADGAGATEDGEAGLETNSKMTEVDVMPPAGSGEGLRTPARKKSGPKPKSGKKKKFIEVNAYDEKTMPGGDGKALFLSNETRRREIDAQKIELECGRRVVCDRRIKLAYISNDFVNHPTSDLIYSTMMAHDESKFEVYCFSLIASDASKYRKDFEEKLGSRFIFLRKEYSDKKCAEMVARAGIDVLINLNGHTAGDRSNILRYRPAPIQFVFLGYPGTSGAHYIDYNVVDPVVCPPEHYKYFSETPFIMPYTYQSNSFEMLYKRVLSGPEEPPDKKFPAGAFVFCNFCRLGRIDRGLLQIWCNILRRVPASVIVLYKHPRVACLRIQNAAVELGIDPTRIIFVGPKSPKELHLRRLTTAHLCLDTFVYNGHTTGSDVLWSGVPFVTLRGQTWCSRVGASLATAVELPEMITETTQEYEDLAVKLATNPDILQDLTRRLRAKRLSAPLFNSLGWTRSFEAGISVAWDLHINKLKLNGHLLAPDLYATPSASSEPPPQLPVAKAENADAVQTPQ